jgi:molybdopterin-guanine dinucleotide biosynthesis protein A
MTLARRDVAVGILAGGQARRLAGADKAMAQHRGLSLLARTHAAIGSGFAQYLLSYNREPSEAMRASYRVVPDLRAEAPGPLAGIEALLAACETDWLLTLPVDLDQIPANLFEILKISARYQGVVAWDADGPQPLVALWRVRPSRIAVAEALDAGEGAVHRVQENIGFESLGFPGWRFGNLNTSTDLQP